MRITNGFEIRSLPNGYVDCVSWDGTVMNTVNSEQEAIDWAESESAPKLSRAAKAELERLAASASDLEDAAA
jgi:hypothetical protein